MIDKKKRTILIIISIILIVFALICGVFAIKNVTEYKEADLEYQELEEYVIHYDDEQANTKNDIPLSLNDDELNIPQSNNNSTSSDKFTIDWDSLYAKNSDIVGWIKLDTGASYPIVQDDNNEYYLTHNFDKNTSRNGAVFMYSYNSSDFSDKNTIIYGHNMRSGSMFGKNDYYNKKSYAEKHPYFYIYTPGKIYTYRVIGVAVVDDASFAYTIGLDNTDIFRDYIKQMQSVYLYDLDVDIDDSDSIITLSTCASNRKHRFLIQGVLSNVSINE